LRIGAVMGWNQHSLGSNLESLEMERTAFLRRPAHHPSALEAAAD
jgi:hypothetical protein